MNTSLAQGVLGSHSYTDLASLNRIRSGAKNDQVGALADIGRQFESMFIRMVLKSMREASAVFSEGNFLNSFETQFRQDMLDNQLSISLTEGQGVGLAASLVQQLGQYFFENKEFTDNDKDKDTIEDRIKNPIKQKQSLTVGQVLAQAPAQTVAQAIMLSSVKSVSAPQAMPDTTDSTEEAGFASAADFVQRLLPYAKRIAEKLGVAPKVILAQSALETGWGKSLASEGPRNSFNLFNIKSSRGWQGDSVVVSTLENKDGVMVREKAAFRAYKSFAESFDDYANFLQSNPRYSDALSKGSDPHAFVTGLQRAGYATDPNYANKILSVMQNDNIKQVPLR